MRLVALQSLGAVAALAVSSCGPATYPAGQAHPLLGKTIPSLRHVNTLGGAPVDAASPATGKPIVVKFFAQYCQPCMKTLPATEEVHEHHDDVLVVGVDEDDSEDAARAMVTRFSLTFPVTRDSGNVLSGRFRVASLPTTFVADSAGVIRWVGGEEQTGADLDRAVSAALAQAEK